MSKKIIKKRQLTVRRAKRTRSRVRGTVERPRLTVYRSLKHIHAQIIDDTIGKTIVASSDLQMDISGKKPLEVAALVGADIAQKAKTANISRIVFDRGSYRYHGRVAALAQAARDAGLDF